MDYHSGSVPTNQPVQMSFVQPSLPLRASAGPPRPAIRRLASIAPRQAWGGASFSSAFSNEMLRARIVYTDD